LYSCGITTADARVGHETVPSHSLRVTPIRPKSLSTEYNAVSPRATASTSIARVTYLSVWSHIHSITASATAASTNP
jgi:hypothetical protein